MPEKRNRGFSMLEMVVSIIFLATISVATLQSIGGAQKTQKLIKRKLGLHQSGSAVMTKMQDDLRQVFFVAGTQKLTFFIGEDNDVQDTLTFTALSYDAVTHGARSSEQSEVTYKVENPKEGSLGVLMRRETPYIDGQIVDSPMEDVPFVDMLHHVKEFELEYSADGLTFLKDWSTEKLDPVVLPKVIRVKLLLSEDVPKNPKEAFFQSLIYLPMQESVGVMAGKEKSGKKNDGQKKDDGKGSGSAGDSDAQGSSDEGTSP